MKCIFSKQREVSMDLDKLREQLTIDEGKVLEVYLDHLGLPTVGIGHLILILMKRVERLSVLLSQKKDV